MTAEFSVYDTVYLKFVGGPSTDEAAQQTIADALTSSTGRAHTVVEVQAAADGGDFRTDDVANFIALGVAGLTDGADTHAVLVVDDRYGDLPDWCDLAGGNVALSEDAGSVAVVALDVCGLDFSGTTAPDAPGTYYAGITVKLDGSQVTTGQRSVEGDGEDLVDVRVLAVDQTGGGTLSFTCASTASDAEAAPISDGVANHDVYVKLTREAFAPTEID